MVKKKMAEFIKKSIEELRGNDGCCHLHLDNNLCLVVGWLGGYDVDDDQVIHATGNKEYCLNIGLMVENGCLSCEMEYDFTIPYYLSTGETYDTIISIPVNYDADNLASYFESQYKNMLEMVITNDGIIIEN